MPHAANTVGRVFPGTPSFTSRRDSGKRGFDVNAGLLQKGMATQIVVLIAVLVIARKLMLQDCASTTLQTMLGFSGLLLSLGGLYWLISDGDRRRLRAASRASPDAAGPDHSR